MAACCILSRKQRSRGATVPVTLTRLPREGLALALVLQASAQSPMPRAYSVTTNALCAHASRESVHGHGCPGPRARISEHGRASLTSKGCLALRRVPPRKRFKDSLRDALLPASVTTVSSKHLGNRNQSLLVTRRA